jgi:hypothetical protein
MHCRSNVLRVTIDHNARLKPVKKEEIYVHLFQSILTSSTISEQEYTRTIYMQFVYYYHRPSVFQKSGSNKLYSTTCTGGSVSRLPYFSDLQVKYQ